MPSTVDTIPFQAETKELLHLVIHSLYTHKEIFLRELISNASDALDKLRVEGLTRSELLEGAGELGIHLATDPEAKLLFVIDNGIGMSRDEVIENVGTIARSGTKRFLDALKEAKKGPQAPELIGQFGVGFYSAFMVAEEVTLETRKAGEEKGTRWISQGQGEYTVEEIDKPTNGTTITLRLKDPEGEDGQDFTQEWVLREIVKRYSDFIEYPIAMEVGSGDDKKVEVLNSRKPLWSRPKAEIEASEYNEFYKHVSRDWNDPLETIHLRVEGTAEYTALLYLPKKRPMDFFDPQQAKSKIQLYVKRVFIMGDCDELLPGWMRFVRGVVDSSDLPLNISRETLQHNRQMGQIKKRLTKKVIDVLGDLLAKRREDYLEFWKSFGPVLKEGIYFEDEHRDSVAKLALFASSKGEDLRGLAEYVEEMPVKQKEIYVLVAPDLETARRSPLLEAFAARNYEVLLLTDPVDDFVLQRLTEFQGKTIRQIEKGDVELDDADDKAERDEKEKELEPVLEAVRKELADKVEEVRFSKRLTTSPACLVSSDGELSSQMRRFLRDTGQSEPAKKRILELNAKHPLVAKMQTMSKDDFGRFAKVCELLWGQALLQEGSQPEDTQRFATLLTELLLEG